MSNIAEVDRSASSDSAANMGMTPEQMEAWSKMAAPGPAHEALKPMVGTFKTEVSIYMCGPDEPQKSTGVMHNQFVLGGRYLESRYQSDDGQMSGIGFVGFDNGARQYTGLWMDTMSTAVMVSRGSSDASGKVITMTAEVDCPGHGGKQLSRNVTTIVDQNTHTYEMYMGGPDGAAAMCMRIVYTRQK